MAAPITGLAANYAQAYAGRENAPLSERVNAQEVETN
jgi:hypothetical protein